MSLTSIEFLVFVIVAVVGYYIIPKRCQWMWLLLFSYIYYASAGIQYLGFILYTTLVTYGTALVIHRIDQTDEAHKKDAKQKKKGVLILALLFVFGLLGVLKYTNFIVQNIDQLFHTDFGPFHLLLPIGLSFYTFQSVGIFQMFIGTVVNRKKMYFVLLCLFLSSLRFCRDRLADLTD